MSQDFPTPPPPEPAGPSPQSRPATVTVAGLLMLVLTLAAVVYLIVTFATLGDLTAAFEEIYAGTPAEDTADVAAIAAVVPAVLYLLGAVTLLILTIFNNRGVNGTRIATWIVGGLGVCCGGFNLIGTALQNAMTGVPQEGDLPSQEEINETLARHLPGWYDAVTVTTMVVAILALLTALILLALPPSNAFFRRPGPSTGGGQGPPPAYPQVG